jgi:transposase-like protein
LQVSDFKAVGVEEEAGGKSVEVAAVARRRAFGAEYKRRILAEADRAGPGEIGLILRREGLYSSHLSNWRRGRSGMAKRKKSKKSGNRSAEEKRQAKEIARLKLKLAKAEAMLDLQKKAAAIWDLADEKSETDS